MGFYLARVPPLQKVECPMCDWEKQQNCRHENISLHGVNLSCEDCGYTLADATTPRGVLIQNYIKKQDERIAKLEQALANYIL